MASHSLNDNTAARSGAPIARVPGRTECAGCSDHAGGARRSSPSCATDSTTPPTSTSPPECRLNRPRRQQSPNSAAREAVADAFAGELATAYARRTIALYVITGPLVGIWWLLLLRPDPWRAGLIALLAAIPVLPLIIARDRHRRRHPSHDRTVDALVARSDTGTGLGRHGRHRGAVHRR